MSRALEAGVARRKITPPKGVELAGLGYYLERTWERVRDDLTVTALALCDGGAAAMLITADLMYNSEAFTRQVRDALHRRTGIAGEGVCVNFSHSHNAPTAGLILGGGAQNFAYLDWAAEQAADAAAEAWQEKQRARLFVGESELREMTFNRTRENGPVDTRVGVLRAESVEGKPIAAVVNFHSHCTAHMESELRAVSRDWPGEVVDAVEGQMPGAIALYLQGTCGDVNFKREFNGTERRFEPGRAVAAAAVSALEKARAIDGSDIGSCIRTVKLPTRRWSHEEIWRDRNEGLHRLQTGDTTGWLDGVARVCVNLPERLPLRYGGSVEKAVAAVSRFAVEWTDLIMPVLEQRPEELLAEIQALRIGNIYLCAYPCELFTSQGLEVRREWGNENLLMAGFANGSIGYLPDAFDIERRSYAAIQSPKFTGQFPFTAQAGPAMVAGLLDALETVRR